LIQYAVDFDDNLKRPPLDSRDIIATMFTNCFINEISFFSSHCSLGPLETIPRSEMVSRRKILSRSRDDLNLDIGYGQQVEEEEDVWYQKDKLFKVGGIDWM
jgi:hypothetical protein